MINREIIINGLDTIKCPISEKCEEFENCKIKDILRRFAYKEQECEEYKAQAKKYLVDYFEESRKCEELKRNLEGNPYKQAFKEIEEIVKNISEIHPIITTKIPVRIILDIINGVFKE